ncbi:MAG: FAD-dependent oxidoreductase [candidate division KSB1 bacterium]|nr:FAD-dependent oxidoreductase [candidate division KSB1 bacterium]
MAQHQRFRFKTKEELFAKLGELGITLPFDEDVSVLFDRVTVAGHTLANRFLVHPIEGFDAGPSGGPTELTYRRYRRYAAGGSAFIWFEATAVVPEGRSNPRQLWLHPGNVEDFGRLVEQTRKAAREAFGAERELVCVLQLTHSGRYSKPTGRPAPIIAHHSRVLDPLHQLPPDYPLISDSELDRLQEMYVAAARLAAEAGFDGVDVKACHRYLVSELLASFTREGSKYGGSFENRTRFLREVVQRIKQEVPGLFVTTRLNVYDAIEYPYGFGVSAEDHRVPDLKEPIELIGLLKKDGIPVLNLSIGNPYYNPHYGRPYDFPIKGGYIPDVHPLEGIELFLRITRQVQQAHPDLPVVGSGYSWLRFFLPFVAAGVVRNGWATLIGVGRGALAYPDFVRDLQSVGVMDPYKCCISCSACTQIMRDGQSTGCVIHDKEIYAANYRLGRRFSLDRLKEEAERCRNCATPFCQRACPAQIDVPGFIKAFADGDLQRGYQLLTERNVLPEMCAYVCPTEVLCEGSCVEKILTDNAVAIRDIQLFLAKEARERGLVQQMVPANSTGKKVAVVGAGPAGLACAIALVRKGHSVEVLEAAERPGGVVRHLIPAYRIPFENADREMEGVLRLLPNDRLQVRYKTPLTPARNLEELLKQFDAVFLAIGLPQGKSLATKAYENLVSAIDFLAEAKKAGRVAVPRTVAVIGGGNTGMDAAITAKQNGARNVYVMCFESFATMPAWLSEKQLALLQDVHFMNLFMPKGYVADNGRVKAVRLAPVELEDPDARGFCAPRELPGAEFEIPVDMVIEALGQKVPDNLPELLPGVKLGPNNLVLVGPGHHGTSRRGVFAGGDIVNGGTTAVQAIADGLAAAEEIDAYLREESLCAK